jgi:glycosyltransferase involved in cell wall biosynthesis
MASGLPVIASKSGGPEEVIGSDGIILENKNPLLISKEILGLLKSKKKIKKYSKASIEKARNFSWKKNAKESYKLYLKVLKNEKN